MRASARKVAPRRSRGPSKLPPPPKLLALLAVLALAVGGGASAYNRPSSICAHHGAVVWQLLLGTEQCASPAQVSKVLGSKAPE
jgi:hypothetical protein